MCSQHTRSVCHVVFKFIQSSVPSSVGSVGAHASISGVWIAWHYGASQDWNYCITGDSSRSTDFWLVWSHQCSASSVASWTPECLPSLNAPHLWVRCEGFLYRNLFWKARNQLDMPFLDFLAFVNLSTTARFEMWLHRAMAVVSCPAPLVSSQYPKEERLCEISTARKLLERL